MPSGARDATFERRLEVLLESINEMDEGLGKLLPRACQPVVEAAKVLRDAMASRVNR